MRYSFVFLLLLLADFSQSRRPFRGKTLSSRTNPNSKNPKDSYWQSSSRVGKNEQNPAKKTSFEFKPISFHDSENQRISFNWLLYVLVGVVVVVLCRYFLHKLHEQQIDELCVNGRNRGLQREAERRQLEDIASGASSMIKPEDLRKRMRHKKLKL